MMLIGVTSLTQVVIKKTHTSFSASCFHPLCKIAFLECSPIVPGLTCAQELALLFSFLALASLSSCLLLNLYELQMSVGKYYCFCQVPRHIKERILHCWVRGYPEVCKMTCTYRDCLSESMLHTVEAECWKGEHSRAVTYSSFSCQHCPSLLSSHFSLSPISLSLLSFEILRQDCMYLRLASKPRRIRG